MINLDLSDAQPIYLCGWGHFSPPLRYTNAEVCEALGLPPTVAAQMEQRIGTRFRRTCVDLGTKQQIVAASTMAYEAASLALQRAQLPPTAVQAIVTVSTILDYFCPSNSVYVQKRLGLNAGLTYDLVGGCGAWAQGLMLAAQFLHSGLAETILVIAAEPLTRQLWTSRRAWEALAFGDGAAAMLFSTRHPGPFVLRRCVLNTVGSLDGCRDEVMTIPVLAPILPPLLVENDRVEPGLPHVDFPDAYRSTQRPDLAAKFAPRYMAEAIKAVIAGIPLRDVYICPHQPSRVVLDALREELQLDPSQVAVTNPDLGNLSSASSPTAFCVRFAEGPAKYPWTVIAPLGTGLTYGAALLERVRDADRDSERDDHRAATGADSSAMCHDS